jgi:phosphate transport system permease protein
MSQEVIDRPSIGTMPDEEGLRRNISARQFAGKIWQGILFFCTAVGIFVLAVLLTTIINEAFGLVAIQTEADPDKVTGGVPIAELSQEELVVILENNLSSRILRRVEREAPLADRSVAELRVILNDELIKEEVVGSWPLNETLFNRSAIETEVAEEFPRAQLQFKSWLDGEFLTTPMSSVPALAGVRTALLGSLWLLLITALAAFPLGVGAAIYLEEYSTTKPFDERTNWGRSANAFITRLNAIIQTNISNLAGVPSIIYGMLGLAIFVRALEPLTSGSLLGFTDPTNANGRTILAAGLTMALLILPIIIISSQEAIRAVPNSLRLASLGLGATKWQTVWNHVLPNALPGILTGTILSMSRAVGETAPLIVVGAATFIVTDPEGLFSTFTALPIQIYNWTARPQDQFRDIAAAAIIVLLVVLLTMNATAIVLRNYLRSKRVS